MTKTGSKPLELADAIRNADKSEEGLIKYICIEIAMETYFDKKMWRKLGNVLQPYAVGAFNHCTNLKSQNYE